MSNNKIRAEQRAAAQTESERLEANAAARARRSRNTALLIIGAMVLSVGGPALFFIFT